ncbi:MAG TPA: phosphotransferase [Pirellulales bacterium]|nr:phosphotransferase [Pirellulales bacterium]
MTVSDILEPVLSKFPSDCTPQHIEPLGNAGGFSGACFWRLSSLRGPLCLRRWPVPHPTTGRLALIHSMLQHADSRGFQKVPVPIRPHPENEATFIHHAGHLWEISPWLPGKANYAECPSHERLRSSMQALARFHVASADFPETAGRLNPAPAILERLQMFTAWETQDRDRLVSAIDRQDTLAATGLSRIGKQIINAFDCHRTLVFEALSQASDRVVPIQPCIRDIWHEHVLFQQDEISGIVDFGAARPDTVATDISRLLGSLAADKTVEWNIGLEAYTKVRSLTKNELHLLGPLDRSTALLSGLNWLRWLYLENKSFEDMQVIKSRLKAISQRIEKTEW